MKNEKKQNQAEKRSVNDFEHRLTVKLEPEHYIEYAMAHSKEQIGKGRKRAIFWAVLFTVLGIIALFRGAALENRWADVYLTAGVLMIVFQLFNLFYNFVMFPIALKRSILKELKKDPSLLSEIEYAFEPDKIVCFMDGKHRSTVMTDEIIGLEDTEKTRIIEIKSGRRIIIPNEVLNKADEAIKAQLDSFKNKKHISGKERKTSCRKI